MKEKSGFLIEHGPFGGDDEGVLAISQSKSKLEDWLESTGWIKSTEEWNRGLWEKKFPGDYNWYWARIVRTTLID